VITTGAGQVKVKRNIHCKNEKMQYSWRAQPSLQSGREIGTFDFEIWTKSASAPHGRGRRNGQSFKERVETRHGLPVEKQVTELATRARIPSREIDLLAAGLCAPSWTQSTIGATAKTGEAEITAAVGALLDKTYTPDQPGAAVIVVKEGNVIFLKGYGKANPDPAATTRP